MFSIVSPYGSSSKLFYCLTKNKSWVEGVRFRRPRFEPDTFPADILKRYLYTNVLRNVTT